MAIVGVGYWGKNLLRTFGRLSGARVTTLCDLDPERLAAARAEHPDLRCTDDFDALIARDDVDAMVIATPPSRHHVMALAALRAGKHVWVEKPLALAAAEGRALVDAAEAASRVLFVDETFLYDPLVREMKRIIDGGGLGDVMHLSFERLGMGRIRRDSNVWWNSAPHDLSILFHLVPRPVTAIRLHQHAYLQPGIADMAVCDLELEGGVSAHIYLSWLHPEKTAKVVVVGRERMLAYEGRFEKRGITLYDYTLDLSPPPRSGRGALPIVPVSAFSGRVLEVPAGDEPLALAAAHFVECIRDGREPLTSGARSVRVVEVLERGDRTATHGGVA
ncbi:MAG TPA: Gfo/Idh/MocA family oxidoreductase [Candidatus Binatia bacterium]|nr:Gfo/Idh/MocA family oxidoreductase [Candidatus Binatia bacterium]